MTASRLDRLCKNFRSALRSLLIRAGVCRLVVLAPVLLALILVLDWRAHLSTPWRVVLLLAYVSALGVACWRQVFVPLRRPWRNKEVLAYLDSADPAGQGMRLALYELIHGEGIREVDTPEGRALGRQALEEAAGLLEGIGLEYHLNRRPVRRWMTAAGAILALFVAAAFPLGDYLTIGCERLFNPFSQRAWPHRTTITLDEPDGGWTVPQMTSLTVTARVTGEVPSRVTLAHWGSSTRYPIKEQIPVGKDGSVAYTFPEVREPTSFYVAGGDYTTETYDIGIAERPYLERIVAHYDYPDYAGIPDRSVEGGQVVGLEGTKVRLAFECSMALGKAVFHLDGAEPEERPITSGTRFEKTLILEADGGYRVELFEQHGFREAKPERYEIRVTPDRLPEVMLLSPGRDLVATRRASVDVALRATDDFGLRTLQFLYQVDGGDPILLSDHVTGPLQPTGKIKEARFTWDLRKLDLPATCILRYFTRVRDARPGDRGMAETDPFEIRLLRPSDFHFETFEEARRIEAEARIAWESQYAAWELAAAYRQTGTGKEDDPTWLEMTGKQDLSIRASLRLADYLRDLTRQYEQNDMKREFMARRLGQIATLLRRVTETEHRAVSAGLRRARPRTRAEAAPDRLKQRRAAALAGVADHQTLALLHLERLLKRLFDWRDLQATLIRTSMLHDEQTEALSLTEELAPKTLGWELEDLPDAVQDGLLTLAKRQRTLCDIETELEKELEFQMYRAEVQDRHSIVAPLRTAYRGLRENRVNYNLKLAAEKIENNQAFQIVGNQKAALHVLNLVKGGLIHAGQDLDEEQPITLAMAPSKIIEVRPKPPRPDEQPTEPTEPIDATEIAGVSPEELLANLPLGSDPLTTAISVAWEAQDQALARTRFLHEHGRPSKNPRYVKMKQGILLEKQQRALEALDVAVREAEKAGAEPAAGALKVVREEFRQSEDLVAGMHLAPGTQQIQADAMATLDDLRRQYLPVERRAAETAEENVRRGGVDAFNRTFLLRDADLAKAVGVVHNLNHARLLQDDVLRKLTRFVTFPATAPATAERERSNRARAAAIQERLAALLDSAAQRSADLSDTVAQRVRGTGLDAVLERRSQPLAGEIRTGARDRALTKALQETRNVLAQTIEGLLDLLEERERPKSVQVADVGEKEKPITVEEWERLRSPEVLREKVKTQPGLTPEMRAIVLRALASAFPPRYKTLLSAYYASFIKEKTERDVTNDE